MEVVKQNSTHPIVLNHCPAKSDATSSLPKFLILNEKNKQ